MDSADKNGKISRVQIAVRVAPVNYLVLLLIGSFVSAFLLYLEVDLWSYILLGAVWTVVPLLAFTDRVVFDGRRIRRTGLLPRLWAYLTETRDRVKLSDVEMVQTGLVRTIKRGGNLFYTYRTAFHGKGKSFVIHSNRRNYGAFIAATLPRLDGELLDRRSLELRDHFDERRTVRERARAARIPSADILEDAIGDRPRSNARRESSNPERAAFLHDLANQLRVSGLLPQSIEAFRRAARHMPRDAGLLLDFGLCLRAYAGTRKDRRLERRASALMRLAERRAGDDVGLLSQIGESYFQFGDWRRAAAVLRRAADRTGEHFRTLIGLAEISLHEGKIAHVIHNFNAASEVAATPALKRWTRHELAYFSRLQDDDEYMELEISRLNLIDTLESVKRSALRIALIGFPAIAIGILGEDILIANIGWAVSIIALATWSLVILGINVLAARIPYDHLER